MTDTKTLQKVVLMGASGNLGEIVLSALHAAKAFQLTVLTRSPQPGKFPAGVMVVQTTYAEAELVEILKGHDAVVSTVGATGFSDQKVVIDAAIKAGVQRFIPSELSMNTLSKAVRELVPVFEAKKVILNYLKEKESTGLTWTGLAGGPLLDWGLQNGFLGFDLSSQTATIWDDGETKFSASNQGDLGRAVVSILQHPEETANRYLYVQTLVTSQKEILHSLEQNCRTKWTVQKVKTDEHIKMARQQVSQGDFAGMITLVQASGWGSVAGLRANFSIDEELANSTLGLPEGEINTTVQRVLKI